MRFVLLFTIFTISLSAQILNIKESYFVDNTNSMDLEQVIKNKNSFKPLNRYNFGFSKDTYWVHLNFENRTDSIVKKRFYNRRAGIDFIDVFILKDNQIIQNYYLGDMQEHTDRDNHFRLSYFDLTINPYEKRDIYIKQRTLGNMDLHWESKDIDSFEIYYRVQGMVYFFIVGILFVATGVSLLFYIILKKNYYIIYSLLTVFSIIYQLAVAGFLYEFGINLYLNSIALYVSPFLAVMFLGLFPLSFFDFHKDEYKTLKFLLKLLLIALSFVIIINLLYPLFDDIFYYTKYTVIINSLIMLLLLLFSIKAFKDRKKGAFFYLMSNTILVSSILYFNFGILGFVENSEFFYYSLAIGAIAQDLFLALALVHATYLLKIENEKNNLLISEYSKLSFIGQTMLNISHQWKTPVNTIFNSINHIKVAKIFKDPNIESIIDKNLAKIEDTTLFLKDTALNQLDFYKSDSKKEIINIYHEITFLIKLLESEFSKKSIDIDLNFNKTLNITIEKNYFLNILMILFENSYKLFEQRDIQKPYIKIEIIKNKNSFELKYRDNAQGAKDDIDRIFDKNYSMSSSTGLGLHLAKEIVEYKLNGTIDAINIEKGILFSLNISTTA